MKIKLFEPTDYSSKVTPSQRERKAMIDPVDMFTQGHKQGQQMVIEFINKFCNLNCETTTDVIKVITQLQMECSHD